MPKKQRPESLVTPLPEEQYSTTENVPQVEAIFAMRRDELKPEVRSYADNLHAQILEVYSNYKVKNFEELKTVAQAGNIPNETLDRLLDLSNQLLTVLEKRELPIDEALLKEAKDLTNKIHEPYAKAMTLVDIAVTEAKAGREPSEDFELAKTIIAEEVEPAIIGGPNRVEAYLNVARAEIQAGHDTTTTLDAAKATAEELAKGHPAVATIASSSFGEIAVFEAQTGKDPKASFDRARNVLESEGVSDGDRQSRYEHIALRLAEVDKFEEAKTIVKTLSDIGRRSLTYERIAEREISAGNLDQAKVTAELIDTSQAELRRGVLWQITIRKAEMIGSFDEAVAVAKTLPRDGNWPGLAYHDIAIGLAKAGRFDEAITQAKDAGLSRDRAYREIVIGLAHSRRFAEARDVIDKLSEASEMALAFCDVAVAEAKAGVDPQMTIEQAKFIGEKAEFDKYLESRSHVLGKIAITFIRIGLVEDGRELAKKIEFEHDQINDRFYRGLANVLAQRSTGIEKISYDRYQYHHSRQFLE